MNTPASQSHAPDTALEDIEVELFVRALKLRHGYDFSQYAPASLKRRVLQLGQRAHHSPAARTGLPDHGFGRPVGTGVRDVP
jgi:hypothetical protein